MNYLSKTIGDLSRFLNFKKTCATSYQMSFTDTDAINKIKKSITADIYDYLDNIKSKTNINQHSYKYFKRLENTILRTLITINNIKFDNDLTLSSIIAKTTELKMRKFEEILYNINLCSLNEKRIVGAGSVYYAFYLTFGLVHYLFVKGTLFDEKKLEIKEKGCGKQLSVLDSKFDVIFNKNSNGILYHIKNSISHGNVEINGYKFKCEDKIANVTIEGNIVDFVDSYMSCCKQIESMLLRDELFYNSAHDIIQYAIYGQTIYSEGMTALLSIIQYLMSDERNRLMVEYVQSSCPYCSNLNNLYTYDLKQKHTSKKIRNSFSHGYRLHDNLIELDLPEKMDGWDWMYCFDSTSIISNLLIINMALGSKTIRDIVNSI